MSDQPSFVGQTTRSKSEARTLVCEHWCAWATNVKAWDRHRPVEQGQENEPEAAS